MQTDSENRERQRGNSGKTGRHREKTRAAKTETEKGPKGKGAHTDSINGEKEVIIRTVPRK